MVQSTHSQQVAERPRVASRPHPRMLVCGPTAVGDHENAALLRIVGEETRSRRGGQVQQRHDEQGKIRHRGVGGDERDRASLPPQHPVHLPDCGEIVQVGGGE